MAEELLYDQVETGNDPDPLGLRKKLAAAKGTDPLGLRAKLSAAKEPTVSEQPQQQFKPTSDWLNIQQPQYTPIDAENVVNEHTIKTGQAAERVKNHLQDIDQSVHNLIYEHKKELSGRAKSEQLGLQPIMEAAPINPQAQEIEHKLRQDTYVSPVEIESYKSTLNEPGVGRQILQQKAKDLSKTNPAASGELKADIYRLDRQNNPDKESAIDKNAEKLKNGDIDYDIQHGLLVKHIGVLEGIVEGFKQKNESYDDYGIYKSGDEDAMLKRIKKRLTQDPDKPIPVPKEGFAHILPGGEGGMMLGGQPLKPLIGGMVAGAAAGPTAGTAAMAAISAPEMYKLNFGASLPQNFAAIKKKDPNLSDHDALQQAIDLTHKQSVTDAATGAAMGAFGGKFAFKPTGLGAGLLEKSVESALKQVGEVGAKKALEGLGVGAIGATGQAVKNLMAQKTGLPIDLTQGVTDQLKSGAAMTVGMHIAAKLPSLLKPKTYNELFHAISKQPQEVIDGHLNELQQSGQITPEEAQKVQTDISAQKKIDDQIPTHIPEPDRLKIQQKIKERNELKGQLETVHEAYHPEIKEKIKKIDEDILNISKGGEHGELQTLVAKAKIEGPAAEYLKNADEKELKDAFKEISEQAHDPNSAAQAIVTFGEDIVNKAKELYPKEEPKQSAISVIQPGEIRQPEIISAGKVAPEQIGHVEVSEHGEDTKTAAGQENGIKPSQLSEEGRQEAKQLGEYLKENKKSKIITSEVERAQETANIAAKEANIPIETNRVLNTWNIGQYDGKPEGSFVEEAWINKPNEAPKGGESFNDFTKRMEDAYKYVKSLPEDNHVISHSKVMRALDALAKTDGKWTDETTKEFLTNKELTHAIQEPSTSSVLQHTQEGVGTEGGGRGGMEQGKQGEIPAGTQPVSEEGKSEGEEKIGPYPGAMDLPFGEDIGIAHEYRTQRAFNVGEEAPVRGEVMEPNEYIERGKELIAQGVDPHQVANDFKNHNKIGVDDISVVRAEYNRLARETNRAADQFGVNSPEDIAAKAAESKWYNEVVKPMQTAWGAMGREQQGQTDIDTGTFTGIRRYYEQETGKQMTPAQAEHAKELSNRVAGLTKEVENLKQKLTNALDKGAEKKTTNTEKAKNIADKFRKLKTKPFKFKDENGNEIDVTKMGLGWNDLVELGAKIIEQTGQISDGVKEILDKIKDADWYVKLSSNDKQKFKEQITQHYEDIIEETPEAKTIRRLQKQLEDLQRGVIKQKGEKIGDTEEIKNIKEQIFEAKKNLGLIASRTNNVGQPKYGLKTIKEKEIISEEQKRINRLEKQLTDLEQGIVQQKAEKFEDTPAITELKDKIYDAKAKLGLISSKGKIDTPTYGLTETLESRNIRRMEKQLEELQSGIVKEKGFKREQSNAEKELKEKIYDAKQKLGLIPSKELPEKPLTNEEKQAKKFENLPEQFVDKKGNKFTEEEAKNIWDYAKVEYLDKGKDFGNMVSAVAKDLGLSTDQVRHALTQPKGAKTITDEMYRKQYQQRMAIQQAQAWVKSANTPKLVKALKFIPHLFFRLKTFGHGTVGGITHAGMNIFRPSAWSSYWPSFFKQFKFAFGKAADYEKAMEDLKNDPEFIKWKRAGLAVDPTEKYDDYQTFDKLLGRLGAAGDRGFNALKVMRLEMAKAEYERLSNVEKADPEVLKEIAKIVNHATGSAKVPLPEAVGTVFFAPRLEVSRWNKLIVQPSKAVATLANWKNASMADKAAAKIVAKRSGEVIATYMAALAANQGILMLMGSKTKVNMTHPTDPDWLKFKIGGKNVDVTGGMVSAMGFLTGLFHIALESKKELRNKTRGEEMAKKTGGYLRGKLSPFASTVADFATHHDYSGNTMPFSKDKPTTKFAHKLTWKEYILNQQTPIPIAEAIKDVTTQMKERGMKEPDIDQIMEGIFIGAVAGGTGARVTENFKKKKH